MAMFKPSRIRFHIIAIALTLMLAAGCATHTAPVPAPPGPVLLAVVTWNMHVGRGDLPRLVADLSSGRLLGRPVTEYVLLLQEAIEDGPHDVARFADAQNLSAFYAPVRTHRQRTIGNAILATRPLDDSRAIVLPQERQPRGAVKARLSIGGEDLFVVSAHLENRLPLLRGGFFADGARGRQADALLEALPDGGSGIFGGDLNTMLGPREAAWRAMAERFPDTPDGSGVPTFRGGLVLDHLFFDLPDGWQAYRHVIADRYGSDHHPVVGLIRQGP